jgi:hypothetical protein
MSLLVWLIAPFLLLAAIYGLHRLCLNLEQRGLLYYWHNRPSGGCTCNPLQEFYQPEIRHVIEVHEQRRCDDEDGAPPLLAKRPP